MTTGQLAELAKARIDRDNERKNQQKKDKNWKGLGATSSLVTLSLWLMNSNTYPTGKWLG